MRSFAKITAREEKTIVTLQTKLRGRRNKWIVGFSDYTSLISISIGARCLGY